MSLFTVIEVIIFFFNNTFGYRTESSLELEDRPSTSGTQVTQVAPLTPVEARDTESPAGFESDLDIVTTPSILRSPNLSPERVQTPISRPASAQQTVRERSPLRRAPKPRKKQKKTCDECEEENNDLTSVLEKVVVQQDHEKNPNYLFALSLVGRLDALPPAKMSAIRSDFMEMLETYENSFPPKYHKLIARDSVQRMPFPAPRYDYYMPCPEQSADSLEVRPQASHQSGEQYIQHM